MTNDHPATLGTAKLVIEKFVIDSSFWFRHSGFLLFLLILILAATLRVHRAGQTSLGFDEVWHLAISTGNGSPHMVLPTDVLIRNAPSPTSLRDAKPVWKVWGNIERALHPPLYFVTLHLWRAVFGPSDFSAQSLSISCSIIMLILTYDFARLRFNTTVASWVCAILAVAPMEIFLHQQTRGYAMLQMFGMASLCALTRIEVLGFSIRRGIALSMMTLGMMLTHYFASGALLAIGLYILIFLRSRERKFAVLALVCAVVLFAIAWGPFIPAQFRDVSSTADTFLKENRSDHVVETFRRLLSLPAQQLFNLPANAPAWALPLPATALLTCLLGWSDPRARLALFFLAGTFGFVAMLDLTRSTTHLLFVRYTMMGLPVMLVLIIAGLTRFTPALAHAASGIAIVACLLAVRFSPLIREEPEWEPMRLFLASRVKHDEPLVFSSGLWAPYYNQLLYLKASHYSTLFPREIVLLTRPMSPQLQRILENRTIWLITPPVEPREWVSSGAVMERHAVPPNAVCYQIKIP